MTTLENAAPAVPRARILVVDDDQSVRESVARTLQRLGYDVTRAASAELALEAVAGAARFDLVISDVVMRGMSGVALAQQLHAHDHTLQLILISGYPGSHLENAVLPLDRLELLQKPFTPSQLAARVRARIQRASAHGHISCTEA